MVFRNNAHEMAAEQRLDHDGRGRMAHTPAHIPMIGWKEILLRVFHAFSDNNLSIIAAGASFYGLLAIFPGIAAFVAIYGLFLDPHTVVGQVQELSGILPDDVIRTVAGQMAQIADRPRASLGIAALFTLALAIWSARRGTHALMIALNVVYAEKESRNLIVTTLVSVGLTLAIIVGLAGITLLAAGIPIVFAAMGATGLAMAVGRGIGLGAGALLLMLGIAGLYRYAPSRKRPKWRWVIVGAAIVTMFWIVGSLLFSVYVAFSHSYSATYGSIGAVVVVLTWLYITILIMLVGGEINAQLEFQTTEDTTVRADKPMGERGAFVADNVAKRAEDIDFDAEDPEPR